MGNLLGEEDEQKQLLYLESEIKKLNSLFNLYKSLYTDDDVITSMNKISPNSFIFIQSGLELFMLMSISKLTDKKVQHGHQNLSIDRAFDIARKNNWPTKNTLRSLIDRFKGNLKSNPFRELRHAREAHIRLTVGMGHEQPPSVYLHDIQEKIDLLNQILSHFPNPHNVVYIEDHYKLSDFLFKHKLD